MADEIDELIGFLSDPKPQVRSAAVDIVRGLTGGEDGLRALAARADRALPALIRLLASAPGSGAGEAAADSLVNLIQDAALGAVDAAMDVVARRAGEQPALARSLIMLLVNVTHVASGVAALLQVGDEKVQGLYSVQGVLLLPCAAGTSCAAGLWGLFSVLQAEKFLLIEIRLEVAGTIRNCCFEADTQLQNLLSLAEYLWPALLLPVAGKKIYTEEDRLKMPLELSSALSHEREAVEDSEIRQQTLEAIYMIVLQVGYEGEEDPKVMEAYELIGSLLVGKGEGELINLNEPTRGKKMVVLSFSHHHFGTWICISCASSSFC